MEQNHETLTREVSSLKGTVGRVEQNQVHAEELNKLRFASLDTAVGTLTTDLKGFMSRIENIISGEIETAQSKQGKAILADYQRWHDEVDAKLATVYTPEQRMEIERRLDSHDKFETQGRLLARIGVLMLTSNVIAIIAAIAAVIKP